jgi:Zn-finger nucleic acid-binding protein
MNCPLCNTLMSVFEYEDTQIDRCPSCAGVWLDKGEINKVINTEEEHFSPQQVKEAFESSLKEKEDRQALLKDIKSFKHDIDLDELETDEIVRVFKKRWSISRDINCPKCNKLLEECDYADSGVILDRCPDKCGFWLDKEELGKLQIMMEHHKEIVTPVKVANHTSRDEKISVFDVVGRIIKWIIRE